MGHQVEDAGDQGTASHGQHHVAELGHSAVGQALLEVHLGEGNGRPQKAGDRADHGNHRLNRRELGVEGIEAGDEEHPRGHHRCGVNRGRDGRWALHGIGQPDVKGELG